MAHQDVVPVEAGTEKNWKYPPFGGCVEEGKIWGRGSLDIKSQLIAHMCAVEKLIKKKFSPKRTFYFAYGFDEELAGQNGARKIAEYLFAKNIRLEGVLDEGGCVLTEVMKGVDPPLAGVGVGEKGHCNFVLTVGAGSGTSSHSSMPPPHTALGYAGQLICALEANPMPARLTPTMRVMLQNIGGEMGFLPRLAIANIVLFRPLLLALLARVPTLNALVRTTLAVTMAHGSDAPNALPACAEVVVNARILPGDTLDSVEAHIRTVAARARVTLTSVRRIHASSPSALSRHDTRMYRHIERLVAEIYPGAVCTPMLLVGGTDSVHYASLCDNVYRFMPFLITDTEKNTIHGTNEYISIANFARMIYFFEQFIFHYDE